MASIKKYNGSTFVDAAIRKYSTASEIITPPTTIYADGSNATVNLKGNTVQNGTPTPSNPVDVNGVGVRTENIYNKYNVINVPNLGTRYGQYVPEDVYSIYNDTDNNVYWGINDLQARFLACAPHSTATIDMSVQTGGQNYGFQMAYNDASLGDITIVQGSTVPDHYIPYGYKIPILTAQQTTNIYLGSTQSNRQIQKLVLTGDEDWLAENSDNFYINTAIDGAKKPMLVLCTHQASVRISYAAATENIWISGSGKLNFTTTAINHDVNTLKTWLAQQYANGTPVTVWYVLDTATTAAVNEPLMQIGTYADSISNAVSIPTTDGANSITVDTTVQPSEFTATWTGWHDSSVKEYDGTNWQ